MNSSKPIGGYLELALPAAATTLHDDALQLNSGRACFEYILRLTGARHVYLPIYTCDAMAEPLRRLGISYTPYAINEQLELAANVPVGDDELIVYTNYFGLKDAYCQQLAAQYGQRLVLDYSQAYYGMPSKGSHTFYSPRKFFGLPDGGLLYTHGVLNEELPTAVSYDHASHLLQRIDVGAEAGYQAFQQDEASLENQPLALMSQLTNRLLSSVDERTAAKRRQQNAAYLAEHLQATNQLTLPLSDAVPLCYPFLSNDLTLRQRLIAAKIFVPTYWPNVLELAAKGSYEQWLAQQLLPLPIDQRYDEQDMQRIIEVIRG